MIELQSSTSFYGIFQLLNTILRQYLWLLLKKTKGATSCALGNPFPLLGLSYRDPAWTLSFPFFAASELGSCESRLGELEVKIIKSAALIQLLQFAFQIPQITSCILSGFYGSTLLEKQCRTCSPHLTPNCYHDRDCCFKDILHSVALSRSSDCVLRSCSILPRSSRQNHSSAIPFLAPITQLFIILLRHLLWKIIFGLSSCNGYFFIEAMHDALSLT